MCLILTATGPAIERPKLEAAVAEALSAGLSVEVEQSVRWPWARNKPTRVNISEKGGCACSLLHDNADWDAETWLMQPEMLEPLAKTLEILSTRGPARARKLGTHTRYMIKRESAG